MDDLFQIGCVGLIKAIDNFDITQDVQFSTYGVPMIIGEIRRYLGAIIGAIVAILIFATGIYKLFVVAVIIVIAAIIGNYVQNNKEYVKDKLKNFIDRF